MLKISVAMACYNGERFLPKQLDSILCQLSSEDELVLSYDPSSDSTLSVLEDYAAKFPQIKVIMNSNHGVAGNFNHALEHCTGDVLFICDQDDIWDKNKKDVVLRHFEKGLCDMVIHNGVHIDADDRIISDSFFQMYRIGNGKIRNLLKPRYSGCCIAFSRSMAEKILPIPIDIDAYDHWVGTMGEFCGKIDYEEQILLYHRLHENNVTVQRRRLKTILRARLGLIRHLRKRLAQIKARSFSS